MPRLSGPRLALQAPRAGSLGWHCGEPWLAREEKLCLWPRSWWHCRMPWSTGRGYTACLWEPLIRPSALNMFGPMMICSVPPPTAPVAYPGTDGSGGNTSELCRLPPAGNITVAQSMSLWFGTLRLGRTASAFWHKQQDSAQALCPNIGVSKLMDPCPCGAINISLMDNTPLC